MNKYRILEQLMLRGLLVIFLYFIGTALPCGNIIAQRCGTHIYYEHLKSHDSKRYERIQKFQEFLNQEQSAVMRKNQPLDVIQGEEPVYKIPIVVHIMHNNLEGRIGGAGNSNITDEQILSQIEVLNEDFRKTPNTKGFNTNPIGADVKIEFCLANQTPDGKPSRGINRVYYGNKPYNYLDYSEEVKMKAMSYWPSDQYLNIWVVDVKDGILGITPLPNQTGLEGLDDFNSEDRVDGCTVHYTAFGRVGELNPLSEYGRSATHEIGHWLGLIHIWGDSFCGNDYVSDTPTQAQSSIGLSTRCPNTFSTCSGKTTQDLNSNYMDYSPDVCMNIFTLEQKNRMRRALLNSPRRAAILNNNKSCSPNVAISEMIRHSFDVGFSNQKFWISCSSAFGNTGILIYNLQGIELLKATLPNSESYWAIDMTTTSMPSTYLVKIQTPTGFWVKKLVSKPEP